LPVASDRREDEVVRRDDRLRGRVRLEHDAARVERTDSIAEDAAERHVEERLRCAGDA